MPDGLEGERRQEDEEHDGRPGWRPESGPAGNDDPCPEARKHRPEEEASEPVGRTIEGRVIGGDRDEDEEGKSCEGQGDGEAVAPHRGEALPAACRSGRGSGYHGIHWSDRTQWGKHRDADLVRWWRAEAEEPFQSLGHGEGEPARPPGGGDEDARDGEAGCEKGQERSKEAGPVVPLERMFTGGNHDATDGVVDAEDWGGDAVDGCGPPGRPGIGEDEQPVTVGGERNIDRGGEEEADAACRCDRCLFPSF